MSNATTIYDIRLRYSLDDKAGKGLAGIEQGAARASASSGALVGMLGRLGALAAGGFGIAAAGKALIGFNSGVEDTKLQIAGMLALTKKTDLTSELKNADKVFGSLQKRASSLPGTTAEYAKFAGMITQPIIDAGLGMKDLEDLTVNSVVAAKALGIEAEVAARDIDQALRGQFHSTDVFSGKLLGSIGYKGEEGRAKYNQMGGGQRASELKRALMQKQLTQMALAQGQTFSGILSTFQDTLQQTLGKVGLPLFKAITDELKSWNAWADANAGKLTQWGQEFGQALVEGFRFVKDAIGFLIAHKDELMTIGKIWLAVRVGQGLGGIAGMLGGAGGGLIGAFTKNISGDGGAKGVGGAVLKNAGAVAAAGMFGWEVGRQLDQATGIGKVLMEPVARLAGVWSDAAAKQDAKFQDIQRSMARLDEAIAGRVASAKGVKGARGTQAFSNLMGAADVRANDANTAGDQLRAMDRAAAAAAKYGGYGARFGSFNDPQVKAFQDRKRADLQGQIGGLMGLEATGNIAATTTDALMAAAMASLTEEQRKSVDVEVTSQAVMSEMIRSLNVLKPNAAGGMSMQLLTYDQVLGILRTANGLDEKAGVGGNMKAPGKVNVTIQRIEVKSEDPDRFAFGMVEAFRDIAKNPSGAIAAIREG